MVTLLDLFSENDQIKKWHQNLTDKKRQLILGLSTSTKALAIASSLEKEDRIVLLILYLSWVRNSSIHFW